MSPRIFRRGGTPLFLVEAYLPIGGFFRPNCRFTTQLQQLWRRRGHRCHSNTHTPFLQRTTILLPHLHQHFYSTTTAISKSSFTSTTTTPLTDTLTTDTNTNTTDTTSSKVGNPTTRSTPTTTIAMNDNNNNNNNNQDAVQLQYIDFAVPSGSDATTSEQRPPVLFLHGLLGNKRNFASIARSLSQQLQYPRRIVGLDLRNHGDNTHDWRNDMSYTAMASDIVQFCHDQKLSQVELVGHSVGGKVAQAVALTQPELISGLVVIDIAPVTYTSDEPQWQAVTDILHALHNVPTNQIDGITSSTLMSKRDVDVYLRQSIPDPALRAFCLTNYMEKTGTWKINLSSIIHERDRMAQFDIASNLKYLGDTLYIHGGQSRYVRHSHLETIRTYFPNHTLTTIRGAGHWVHAEAPEDTTALLKQFLDR